MKVTIYCSSTDVTKNIYGSGLLLGADECGCGHSCAMKWKAPIDMRSRM